MLRNNNVVPWNSKKNKSTRATSDQLATELSEKMQRGLTTPLPPCAAPGRGRRTEEDDLHKAAAKKNTSILQRQMIVMSVPCRLNRFV